MSENRGKGSLNNRLLILALTTVVLIWIAAIILTYYDARKEFDEILDAHLAQTASLLIVQASHELNEIETEHAPLLHKYSRHVAFQIWEGGRVLRLHSANAPAMALSKEESGFSNNVINGISWRVFSIWDESGKNLIHVAELNEVRDDMARDIASNLLKPLLFSLPLLSFLLWVAVARGLHPLVKLTSEVALREPKNLAPLDASTVPKEVVPLIERLNSLFVRIDTSMQNERRFTADAAHELRTPVAAIKAQAQVALGASNEEDRIRALNNVILGCNRAVHLIEQLLTLARIDTLGNESTEHCHLNKIAIEVISAIAPTAIRQGIHLELIDDDEGVIPGNAMLLQILLRNLVDNAVRYTNPGTSIQIKISHVLEKIYLTVSDNGPGIAKEEITRVTERFYRPVETRASGSGLGLSIVKRIAEIHDATLKIEAQPEGSGLQVTVIFKADVQ
jgi:two-component system sensor histidine kinase QseC